MRYAILDRINGYWQQSPLSFRVYTSREAADRKCAKISQYFLDGRGGVTTEASVYEIGDDLEGLWRKLQELNAHLEPKAVTCKEHIGKPGYGPG